MLRWIVGFVCLLACSRPLAADEQAVNVFDRVEGSVVELRNALGSGTGIVLNREGLILTNAHVIASQLHFRCLASLEQNGVRKTYVYQKVQVLGVHSQKDLAVVKIDPAEHPVVLPPVRISAVKARPGQQVFAIGNPGGKGVSLTKTITAGLVSGVDRAIEGVMYYQISAPINAGNSGGPLTDAAGTVLGLVTLKMSDVENIGFVIPLYDLDLAEIVPLAKRPVDKAKAGRLIEFANKMSGKFEEFEKKKAATHPVAQIAKSLATSAYLEALLNEPSNPTLYRALAVMMEKYGEKEAAYEFDRRTLEMMPWGRNGGHYRTFGVHLLKAHRGKDAEIVWREGLAKFPIRGSVQMWEDLAILFRDQGNYVECGHCAGMALLTAKKIKDAKIRTDLCTKMVALSRQKVADDEQRKQLEDLLAKLQPELTALAVQSDEHRKKQTLAIRDDFKEFLVREKIDLAAARHAPAAIQLTNQMIPPKVGPGGTEAAPSEGKNLLAALDVSQNGVQGTWLLEGGKLVSPTEDHVRLQVPAELPAEYDLTLDVVRVAGQGELAVGLLREGTQSVFLVDVGGAKSGIAGRKTGVYAGAVLPEGQKVRLLFRLRHDTFTVTAADKQIFSANEEPLPAVSQTWQVRDPSKLFLGANHSVFRVELFQLRAAAK